MRSQTASKDLSIAKNSSDSSNKRKRWQNNLKTTLPRIFCIESPNQLFLLKYWNLERRDILIRDQRSHGLQSSSKLMKSFQACDGRG